MVFFSWYTTPAIIATTTTNPLSLANSNLTRENQSLSSEVSNLESTISANAARINALDAQNAESEAEANNLRNQLQEFEELLNTNSAQREVRQRELIAAATRQREARQREVNAARSAASTLRDDNECTDNQEAVRQQIERQRQAAEAQRRLNASERERQQRLAELIQQEEEQEERLRGDINRSRYANNAQVSVDFLDRNDNNQNQLLPVNLPQSDNIDELTENADVTINNIFTNHYNKNLTTYMQNRIKINDMKNKIDKLNSTLHKKVNNNITYGTDGEMTFY
jgi:chromosome segregation ATPase